MRRALFAFFDNPDGDPTAAIHNQIALVQEADRIGMDEVWVSEHHFNDFSLSGPILPIMGYLLGATRRIAVGSAAVLLPYHNPILVAEALALLERLNPGRLRFGMAKGAFPLDDRHFRSDPERNREALFEAALLIARLLREKDVTHRGEYFTAEEVTLVPSPSAAIPPYLATFGSQSSVRFAAEQGFGLMMGQTATLEDIYAASEHYKSLCGHAPDLVALRLCCIDDTPGAAESRALRSAQLFSERMRRVKAGNAARNAGSFQTTRDALFSEHPMARCALAGTPESCAEQLTAHRQAGVTSLAIRPGGATFEENLRIVGSFNTLEMKP